MEIKNINASISDVDQASRRVKVVISAMENLDHDGDVISEKAYDKTIAERGPKGKNLIYFLRDHDASVSTGLIGKFSELYTQNKQLVGVATLPQTTIGNDMLVHYQSGNISQHSVGFKTVEAENVKGYRLIKQIKMFEGSAVLFGANELTPTLSVGKGYGFKTLGDLKTFDARYHLAEDIFKEHDEILKELKSGKHAGDNYELLVVRFDNIATLIKSLVLSTEAADEAPLPEKPTELIKRVQAMNHLIKSAPASPVISHEVQDMVRKRNERAGRIFRPFLLQPH